MCLPPAHSVAKQLAVKFECLFTFSFLLITLKFLGKMRGIGSSKVNLPDWELCKLLKGTFVLADLFRANFPGYPALHSFGKKDGAAELPSIVHPFNSAQ